MKTFEKGRKVVIVTQDGVICGSIKQHNKFRESYTVVSHLGIFYDVKKSHVYPKSDYGKASNFFESRYL
jgi:hypothetical protein